MKNLQTEQPLLIWQENDLIKEQWVLANTEPEIFIGRSPDCTVSIPVRWISRTHAVLRRKKGQFLLEDAGSKNGVFVNGQRQEGTGFTDRPGRATSLRAWSTAHSPSQ
jgi:pSer/pThr/pTyr-binding forkhead associated (FHA) protein